jgi:hypothetical protein
MRRYSQAKLILAIISFSSIAVAVPASAATHDFAIGTSAATRYAGSFCTTVHSNVHHRTAVVCVGVALGHSAAFVSLMPRSGKLDGASASRLILRLDGTTIEAGLHRIQRSGNGFILSTMQYTAAWYSLWDGGHLLILHTLRSGVFNACMQWRDGDRACTGASWLYGKRVFVTANKVLSGVLARTQFACTVRGVPSRAQLSYIEVFSARLIWSSGRGRDDQVDTRA